MRSCKILVVEDFDPFRQFVVLSLRRRPEFQLIYEASDGLEAVQRSEDLQPDLILLDVGLPRLGGIEAGRRIRKVSPDSKILYVSQELSAEVVQEALHLGALGYLLKADAGGELLPAVDAVLQGRHYLSRRLRPHVISKTQMNLALTLFVPKSIRTYSRKTGASFASIKLHSTQMIRLSRMTLLVLSNSL